MTRPLKIRALQACLREALNHGCHVWVTDEQSTSDSPTALRASEYFRGARRRGQNVGDWAAGEHAQSDDWPGKYLDYCAAAQGWAERVSALPGEPLPPHRLGAYSELWQDALHGLRGRVMLIEQVRQGRCAPPPGALAVFHRGGGRGHVERVIYATREHYWSVGANEGGRPGKWRLEWRPFADSQLVGFCEADDLPVDSGAWDIEPLWELRRLSGIDLSNYNKPENCDWDKLRADHDFAIFRGVYYSKQAGKPKIDGALQQHWHGCGEGIPRGLYHWWDSAAPLDEQLQLSLDITLQYYHKSALDWRIAPVIDVESRHGEPFPAGWWRSALETAIPEFTSRYGNVIIYGSPSQLGQLGDGAWHDCPLWVSHYTRRPEPMPVPGWGRWSIWQYRANEFPSVPAGGTRGYADGKLPIDLNLARELPNAACGHISPFWRL